MPPASSPQKPTAKSGASASSKASAEVAPVAKRPRVGDTATRLQKPTLPSEDAGGDQPARDIMKLVVPWVHEKLPVVLHGKGLLQQGEALSEAKPLDIASKSEVSSYKEAWKPANCATSCQRTGYYEAGGSGFWIDPEVGHDGELPFADCGWDVVAQVSQSQFVAIEHNGARRIRFPVAMSCWWRSGVQALRKDAYPSGIVPLGGKPYIWAWYVEMFKAMESEGSDVPESRITMLYECFLTMTILMFTASEKAKIVEESIKMSEIVRTSTQVASDSFVTFARKVLLIGGADMNLNVKDLAQRDIRFHGGQVNTTMVQTIKLMQSSWLSSPDCTAKLNTLDRNHGQEVLTASYNKIKLFLSATKNDAATCSWVLDQMLTALDRKEVGKSDFLLEAYKKPRNGSANFVHMAMSTKAMVEHCDSIVQGLFAMDEALANKLQDKVLSKLRTPRLYNQQFPVAAEDVADDDGSGVPASKDDFMEEVTSCCPRSGVMLAEMLKKVYDGDYNDAALAIATSDNPTQTLNAMDEQTLGVFAKDMAELLKALHAADSVVGLSSMAAAPKATLRELVRASSDGGDKEQAAAERQDVWKRAVANRKKLVSLIQVKNPKLRSSYTDALNKASSQFTSFKGKVGESHRVFAMSSDLLNQKGKQPWVTASPPDEKIFEEMIAFLTTHGRGEHDVIMAWDGCNRKSRRSLEDSIGQLAGCAEVFIVYSSSWNGWVKKKYHLGSENTECGYVAYARQKSHTGCKDRSADFRAAGESNSHFTSFTGVALPGRSTLARISESDKQKIFAETTDPLPQKWLDNVPVGVPMYWQETKSVSTWYQLLEEVQAGCVIDVSPGSGVLASACMRRGMPYVGLVSNAQHLTWLTNVVDRSSCKYMCTTGNHLYQEDLATLLAELFSDVVDPKEDATAEQAIQQPDVD